MLDKKSRTACPGANAHRAAAQRARVRNFMKLILLGAAFILCSTNDQRSSESSAAMKMDDLFYPALTSY